MVEALRARGHTVNVWGTNSLKSWGPWLRDRPTGDLTLVASWADAHRYRSNRVVYLEHGAGQTYVLGPDQPDHGYAGAGGLDHVVLFLGPGEHVSERWRARYPRTPAVTVGCPALDRHHTSQPLARKRPDSSSERPLIAISSHWRCGVCPETLPALDHYERGISDLARLEADDGYNLLGHSHPRGERRTRELWARLGIRWEPDPDVVLRSADLLVIDNSSLAFEAAAVGLPVLLLNLPSYRRDVEHGLRFWSHVPGLQCDDPADLATSVQRALADPPEAKVLRDRAARHAYAYSDGRSAERAAVAIEGVL